MLKSKKPVLDLKGISKYYGDFAAIDDVSLTVAPGKFLTLLGPSGSGKTTLLMAIAGFVQPTRGEIMLDGKAITGLPAEKRNFGMVFQGYALFPHMTVAENVGFPLKVRGLAKDESAALVADALNLVQLGHQASKKPNELSGGQQQRVALARAMVFKPALMLLDEPLSALDRKLRADLQWELKSLHDRVGMTFIYVTHDQDEALSMSDEIVVLRDGKIIQQDDPHSLYDRPRTRFVANFMGGSNFIQGKVSATSGDGFRYAVQDQTFEQVNVDSDVLVKKDQDILISLAPEKISLLAEPLHNNANVLEGRIGGVSYFGNSYHIQVETETLGTVQVKSPAWLSQVEPEMGSLVWLNWSPSATFPVLDD